MERYVFEAEQEQLQEAFGVISESESLIEANYNAAPGHNLPIIVDENGAAKLTNARWSDGDTIPVSHETEKAKKEGEALKLIDKHPCIIPISGFYKWKHAVEDPYPFYIRIHSRDVIGIAGYYSKDNRNTTIFTPLITEANVLVQPLDETMPAVIPPKEYHSWLHGGSLQVLEKGFIDNSMLPEMTVVRVPELVNDLGNNSKELIQPIPKLRDED